MGVYAIAQAATELGGWGCRFVVWIRRPERRGGSWWVGLPAVGPGGARGGAHVARDPFRGLAHVAVLLVRDRCRRRAPTRASGHPNWNSPVHSGEREVDAATLKILGDLFRDVMPKHSIVK